MSSRPSAAQWALLSPTERATFRIAELAHLPWTRKLPGMWVAGLPGGMIWISGGRRFRTFGTEELDRRFDRRSSLIVVANHRSFFDFYVICAMIHWRTHLSKRTLFPVRSEFFYDHPLGVVVNATMSGLTMFPPVVRDPKRAAFNRYSLERCVEELEVPGTIVGVHPEGTRNKGDDPYSFLPAQPGVGRVIVRASAPVVPVFVHGLSNSIPRELRLNVTAPHDHPIDILFGEPVDMSDLRAKGSRAATNKRAADRALDAIGELGDRHRRELAGRR
ncbi:MAG: lysophospholipid acyltransferase family protein [Polyangiales bacterium]